MATPSKQISTSVGFQDAKGTLIANGFLKLVLSQNAEITSGGGQVTNQPLVLALDANAKITTQAIWFNDELTPSGTTYHAYLIGSNGLTQIQDFGNWSISGASADLSAMVPTTTGASYPSPSPTSTTVTFSTTPAFTVVGGLQSSVLFIISLAGNVTSSTFTGAVAGQIITFKIVQDSTGSRTFTWPTNVIDGDPPDPTANSINVQSFIYDGTNAYPIGPMTVN